MNKVFKVIWSEARNAYVVVSEMAKSHGTKSCSTKKLLAMLIATGIMTCASMAPAMAADPPAEALKHNTVAAGYNITVTPKDNSDGGKEYNVDLKNDIHLAGDDPDALVGISGSKGTIWATGRVTVGSGVDGSVVMDGTTATVSGLGNTTTAYDDFANGKGKAATEEQLKEISEVAENANQGWNLSTNGGEASKVAPGETVDFSGDQNINISNDGTKVKVELKNDIYLAGDDPNAFVNISGSKGTIWASGSVTAGSVVASDNDGNYSEITPKSAKLGQVTIDEKGNIAGVNSVQTNALNAKYNLSVGTANENGTVPFFVNSNGAFYAANGKLVVDKDGKLVAPEAELGKVTVAADGKISGVAAGAVTADSTDAVNDSQLHQTNENVAQNKADIAANRADIDKNKADIAANRADIDKNKADIAANRADIDKNKADIAANRADIDKNKADIAANRTDIDKNKADIKTLDTRVTDVEALAKKHTTVTAGDNITVTEDTNKDGGKEYKVALDKDIKLDSVTTGQTVMNNDGLKVGDKVSVTATAVTAGKTSISDEGVKVGDKTYISDKGLNANDQKVTNVAAGEISATSKDAVNGSQLYATNQEVANNTNRINQLGSRVNKVGAGAAALAALHPMDFDPDDKLTFSAGYGNYGGENAAAIGAYYRPDEKVMFSVGGTVGNGENMVNAGVSFSLDRTNHVSNSRTAMAREILDLRAEVTELKAMVAKGGLGSIAEDKMKIFPDVAENHWAYEYVGKLAAAGIIEGYPDGNFSGDRMMSRYEFAAMLYRAMQKGAQLDSKIINEFAPEMGRIRVDRISGEDGDRDKIERVRVNAVKGERDHYGNKIAKAEAKAK